MLLVDAVLERSDTHLIARKLFRPDEFFTHGHYPERPLVPGVILCEVCLQSGAVLLAQFAPSGIPVATRMNDVRFRQMVSPGETVEVHVELVEQLANAFFMKAKMTREGKQVMRLEFACATASE
jgi:3-hydroxyacyl-[acyl-carrier-protein] dehydratase